MKISKKLFSISIVFLIVATICFHAFAANAKTVVGGENITLSSEKSIAVPVNIKYNPGIMGFKISVKFSSDVILLESVDQGDVTKIGNFGTKADGDSKVTVLWNNTFQVPDDGSLFILNFTILDSSKNGTISFSYDQEDTFNEKYENVSIKFEEIHLITSKDNETDETKPVTGTPSSTDAGDTGQKTETDTLINSTTAPTDQKLEQNPIIEAAVTEIEKNFSDSEIKIIIDNSLKEIDSPSIDKIPPEKKEIFAEDIREQIAIDDVEIINDLSDDELLSALEKVIKNGSKTKSEKKSGDKSQIIIILAAAFVMLAFSASAVVIIKRKKNKNKSI